MKGSALTSLLACLLLTVAAPSDVSAQCGTVDGCNFSWSAIECIPWDNLEVRPIHACTYGDCGPPCWSEEQEQMDGAQFAVAMQRLETTTGAELALLLRDYVGAHESIFVVSPRRRSVQVVSCGGKLWANIPLSDEQWRTVTQQ